MKCNFFRKWGFIFQKIVRNTKKLKKYFFLLKKYTLVPKLSDIFFEKNSIFYFSPPKIIFSVFQPNLKKPTGLRWRWRWRCRWIFFKLCKPAAGEGWFYPPHPIRVALSHYILSRYHELSTCRARALEMPHPHRTRGREEGHRQGEKESALGRNLGHAET